MDCKHQAKFSFKTLFAKKPTYTCKKCGVDLEMTIMTQSISRALNSILIAALFFKVLAGKPAADVPGMILSFGVLLLYILIYIVAYYFLITFGKFVEKPKANPIDPIVVPRPETGFSATDAASASETVASDPAATSAESSSESTAATDTTAKPALTKEQQDLIALYNSFAPAEEKTETIHESTDQSNKPAPDTCVHSPKKNWKNFIPSQFNFTCEQCGQPITFSQQTKKHVNLAIMAIIFAILMPSFLDTTVSHLKFLGLTAIAVAISTGIQYYFVKKSKYILNPQAPKASQPRRRR